ncbi:FAD/NAD(P)-binding protein [Actinocrispum wychmicini]|uniref:FAD-NAD(P)-binding protein n=1 Tax=Actinocrispum wychmicini TaxID=1213861 RepID=A0A4R2JTM7_9PSEU|nr:FAD/NAD(P)-binding protein [Actinocrispum wychmicini]TCO62507.1 FAD-NAD(P)-binding protein [Actinocrispum wychmicini]
MASIAIIGAGPRGVGVLERLGANADTGGPVDVHLIDPFPPGPGRVWRYDQSPLLRMNSMAEDVTMFLDDSVTCEGPITTGPSLAEWAEGVRDGTIAADLPEDVLAEVTSLTGTTFPTRRLQSGYLTWFFDHTRRALPANFTVTVHRDTVRRISGGDGPQTLWLNGKTIVADVVVFTLGHLDSRARGEEAELQRHARENDLFYLPPEYSADADLSGIRPGEDVLMRGFGLAFIDLMVLLTEGRGGKFRTEVDGTLTYLPSGEEPRLYVGSRRGVPYHAKTNYRLKAGRPPLPRFFGPEAVARLTARDELDFTKDIWPLMAKDIAWGHYHELFNGHPDRVTASWAEFSERFAELTWGTTEMRTLVAETVPRQEDRFDVESTDRPLTQAFDRAEDLQDHLRTLIRQDIDRRENDEHSQDLGAFVGLLSAFGNLAPVAAARKLTTTSFVRDVGWWLGFFNFLASGPPGHRLEELLALSRAGIVRFVGADIRIEARPGGFTATSPSSPATIEATALVEARLPKPTLKHTTNELLLDLYLSGDGAQDVLANPTVETGRLLVAPADLRVIDTSGRAHPRRFALGAPTSVVAAAAFARPHTNAPSFRQNDLVARTVLRTLSPARSTCAAAAGGASPCRTPPDAPGTPR